MLMVLCVASVVSTLSTNGGAPWTRTLRMDARSILSARCTSARGSSLLFVLDCLSNHVNVLGRGCLANNLLLLELKIL